MHYQARGAQERDLQLPHHYPQQTDPPDPPKDVARE